MSISESLNRTIGQNPSQWRKTYGFFRRKPAIFQFVDANSEVTRSLDFQKVVRDRNFYVYNRGGTAGLILPDPPTPELAEYDENLMSFIGETEQVIPFSFTFTSTPTVVFEVENDSEGPFNPSGDTVEGVNLFGLGLSTSQFSLGFSAPFYGTVRWMAVYSPTYPALVTRSIAPDPGVPFLVSAGEQSTSNDETISVSYSPLTGSYSRTLFSLHDVSSIEDSNTYLSSSNATNSGVTLEATAEVNSPVHAIAFD